MLNDGILLLYISLVVCLHTDLPSDLFQDAASLFPHKIITQVGHRR